MHRRNLYKHLVSWGFNNILFWDNPKTGLALFAHDINLKKRVNVKKSIYSKRYSALYIALVKARKDAGITQQQLADKLKKPQSFVAKYENGERRLDMAEFMTIAEELGVDPAKLIEGL